MEIMTAERVKELKPYKFNEEIFGLLERGDYGALKNDIKKNGVKVELHILPDKTVICGHQRLMIAKELKMKHLRCKTVTGLDTPEKVREYVILDNLLRRQLTPEKQAFLLDDLSKQYETGRGFIGERKEDGTFKPKEPNMGSSGGTDKEKENVLIKTAEKVNVSKNTVQRARSYVKAVKENPEYKGQKISVVLHSEKVKKDERRIKEEAPQKKLEGKYKTIIIDPPWKHYGTSWGYQEREKADYATMSMEDIDVFIQEKVMKHIDDNAHIYLWTINNMVHDALRFLDKWGFDYKTMITWCKPQMGMGKYFRNNTEQLLFAVKGNLSLKRHDLKTYFIANRTKHSEKPDEAYQLLEKASHPPYLDVFSRKKRRGWTCMGVEDED